MDKVAVEVKNYSFRYNNTENWVLKDVDFTLNYGELVVLTGMSGEGKSTLMSSINGIIPNIIPGEQKGEIYMAGENIKGRRTSEISCMVGSVLQNADSQVINSKVEDEIAFGCENMNMDVGEIGKQIEYTCELMSLDKSWFTKTLSGGQKQRLITAAILAMKQKILAFDEPLANLDLEGAHLLLKVLKKLTTQGYAILLVEHRLDVVTPYADKIAWLKDGKVNVYSDKKQVLKNAAFMFGRKLKGAKNTSDPCFVLNDVSYTVGGRNILKNLSFTINKGERVVVLGENGCGKTTLMRLLARIINPTTGYIDQYIEKGKKRKPSAEWFKKVGFVYQNPNYQLFMPRVLDEISYQSKGELMTEYVIKRFNLVEIKERHPQSLSEGQKRRLTIACVMAMEPEVILLDEPTVGQDHESLKNIIDSLNEIHEKTGNTMITITHDFRCAESFADKIIWMDKGSVYKIGGPELAKEYFQNNMGDAPAQITVF